MHIIKMMYEIQKRFHLWNNNFIESHLTFECSLVLLRMLLLVIYKAFLLFQISYVYNVVICLNLLPSLVRLVAFM